MAALICGLKQYRQYLLGRHFLVRVDHMALTYYKNTPEPIGQQARFLDLIAEYDFTVVYRPGSRRANANALSRIRPCERDNGEPCKQCNKRVTGRHTVNTVTTRARAKQLHEIIEYPVDPRGGPVSDSGKVACPSPKRRRGRKKYGPAVSLSRTAPAALDAGVLQWSPAFSKAEQLADSDIGPALGWIEDGRRPPWKEVSHTSPGLKCLWQQYESLVVTNGVLYRVFLYGLLS